MFNRRSKKQDLTTPDNFSILKADSWYQDKLGIIQSYIKAYQRRFDLRNKTKMLVYIGSGPGMVNFTDTDQYANSTPLTILGMEEGFQRYIFCEKNIDFAQSLKVRIGKHYPSKHTMVIDGDINKTVDKLSPYLPEKIGKSPTAILCIIDMQSFDLDFETMELLSAMDMDLVLVNSFVHTPYYNYNFYLEEEREQLNAFFGSSWARLAEGATLQSDTSFFMLVVKAYIAKIKQLGYNITSTLHKYNLEDGLVPYYQIAYCTKAKVLKSVKESMVQEASKQTELFG